MANFTTDEDMANQVRAEGSGFGELYHQHYARILGIARVILSDEHLAEDAAQETFSIASRQLETLRDLEKFPAWAGEICRNVARRMVKSYRSRLVLEDETDFVQPTSTEEEYMEQVRESLDRLPAEWREIITLRYFHDLSYEKIGLRLGITEKAVHGRLVRAKRKLKKLFTLNGVVNRYMKAIEKTGAIYFESQVFDGEKKYSCEIWARPNRDETESGDMKFVVLTKGSEQITFVSEEENKSYIFFGKTVKVQLGKSMSLAPWLGKKFFNILKKEAQGFDERLEYRVDPKTGKKYIGASACDKEHHRSWRFEFDRESHLLIAFKQWANSRWEGEPQFCAEKIFYNVDLPGDFFKVQIPPDFEVIELPAFDDRRFGMPINQMTQEEACRTICDQYWRAIIEKDFERAHQLNGFLVKKDFDRLIGENPPVEVISIDEPYQEVTDRYFVTPCRLKLADGETKEIRLLVIFYAVDNQQFCVIRGG